MSGGHFDYKQSHIEAIASEIDNLIAHNDDKTKNEYGDQIGHEFSQETLAKFREASLTLWRAYKMAQRIDWLVSCDDGEESFHRRWNEDLGG